MMQTVRILLMSYTLVFLCSAESGGELCERLKKEPVDWPALGIVLNSQPTKVVLDCLKESFYAFKTKADKQAVAAALVEIGGDSQVGKNDDQMIFNYLSQLAEAAIDHDAPMFMKYDAAGRIVRKEYNLDFEKWCRQNNVGVEQEIRLQVFDLPEDVRFLSGTLDARSVPILKRGILSHNPWIAEASARSLGLQDRTEVVPVLLLAIEQLPGEAKEVVASALPLFNSVEAAKAFQKFIPDVQRRESWTRESTKYRLAHQKRVRARSEKSF